MSNAAIPVRPDLSLLDTTRAFIGGRRVELAEGARFASHDRATAPARCGKHAQLMSTLPCGCLPCADPKLGKHGFRDVGPENLERAKGFEPSTPTLARLCSTPELRPLWRRPVMPRAGKERGH